MEPWILELIGLYRWPFAFVLAAGFGLFLFRRPIEALINRIRRVRYPGGHVDTSPPNQETQRVEGNLEAPEGVRELEKVLSHPLQAHVQQTLLKDPRFASISEPEQRAQILVKFLAVAQIALTFERIYQVIFGSQLKALTLLNTYPGGISRAGFEPLYEATKESFPAYFNVMDFDLWIDFLPRNGLAEKNGDHLIVTVAGKAFLSYLIDRGYSMDKPA